MRTVLKHSLFYKTRIKALQFNRNTRFHLVCKLPTENEVQEGYVEKNANAIAQCENSTCVCIKNDFVHAFATHFGAVVTKDICVSYCKPWGCTYCTVLTTAEDLTVWRQFRDRCNLTEDDTLEVFCIQLLSDYDSADVKHCELAANLYALSFEDIVPYVYDFANTALQKCIQQINADVANVLQDIAHPYYQLVQLMICLLLDILFIDNVNMQEVAERFNKVYEKLPDDVYKTKQMYKHYLFELRDIVQNVRNTNVDGFEQCKQALKTQLSKDLLNISSESIDTTDRKKFSKLPLCLIILCGIFEYVNNVKQLVATMGTDEIDDYKRAYAQIWDVQKLESLCATVLTHLEIFLSLETKHIQFSI